LKTRVRDLGKKWELESESQDERRKALVIFRARRGSAVSVRGSGLAEDILKKAQTALRTDTAWRVVSSR